MKCLAILFCTVFHFGNYAQTSGYSMVKEMGLKKQPRTIKSWSYEAYMATDGQVHKRSERYYTSDVTNFNKTGNITSKDEYSYSSSYPDIGEKQLPIAAGTYTYEYQSAIYKGKTYKAGKITCEKQVRHWHTDKHYTDSSFVLPTVSNHDVLTHVTDVWLNDDYTQKEQTDKDFYFFEVNHNKNGSVTIDIKAANTPDAKQKSVAPIYTTIKKDEAGNEAQQVCKMENPSGETEYYITDYHYEYY